MPLDPCRAPLFNRTQVRTVGAASTTWVGPVPTTVSHVRIYTTAAVLYGLAADNAVELANSGNTRGAPLGAGQNIDMQVPTGRRLIGLRSEAGSPVVYVSELGEPQT